MSHVLPRGGWCSGNDHLRRRYLRRCRDRRALANERHCRHRRCGRNRGGDGRKLEISCAASEEPAEELERRRDRSAAARSRAAVLELLRYSTTRAEQERLDCGNGDAELVSDLLVGQAPKLAQQQRLALTLWNGTECVRQVAERYRRRTLRRSNDVLQRVEILDRFEPAAPTDGGYGTRFARS
jgi:hypothetical protein